MYADLIFHVATVHNNRNLIGDHRLESGNWSPFHLTAILQILLAPQTRGHC